MWHESNVTADDIMMMWFTLFASLVMSCLACAMCTCMHGAFAPNKYGASKYLSSLACMQADLNFRENNCFTFSGNKYPKCKQEHAKHDSHCISQ